MSGPVSHAPRASSPRELAVLSIAALGVVYGDIGTSPIYAFKACFGVEHGLPRTPENVLGILSLISWSLILVVVLKYLAFIMRADNQGEGGILSLLALLAHVKTKGKLALVFLGLFGAALLYGDGMITPAISVLSAMEGLSVATHEAERHQEQPEDEQDEQVGVEHGVASEAWLVPGASRTFEGRSCSPSSSPSSR